MTDDERAEIARRVWADEDITIPPHGEVETRIVIQQAMDARAALNGHLGVLVWGGTLIVNGELKPEVTE
jgi:hypothetical protein